MPSRPTATRRRFHRDRVIDKRIKVAREVARFDLTEIVPGRLDDQQHYIGCRRARCRLCQPEKNLANGERQRSTEAWRRLESLDS
jgi:hypothetical protein